MVSGAFSGMLGPLCQSISWMRNISFYCLVEMERYWLAVLVVAFLTLSSANGAALTGPGGNGGSPLSVVSGF